MKHRNSHLLVGYWSRLRHGRVVPDQTDIDPRAIKRMLSQVFILDACDLAHPTFRLAGTWLCDRFGFELRGTSFLSGFDVQSRAPLTAALKQALAARQPVCVTSIGSTPDSTMVEIESVLAPMRFGQDEPSRFLGMMQFLGDSGSLIGQTVTYQRLVACKLICEDEPLSTFDPPPPPPPRAPLREFGRAPHLRLVVSRDDSPTVHCEMDDTMQRLITSLDRVSRSHFSILGR